MDKLTESASERSGRTIQARLDREEASVRGKGLNYKGVGYEGVESVVCSRSARAQQDLAWLGIAIGEGIGMDACSEKMRPRETLSHPAS